VPTNEQRRANAKRKLQRQLERRAQQARRRRTLAIVGGSVAAAVVVAAIVVTVVLTNRDHNNKQASAAGSSSTTATAGPVSGPPLPAFKATSDLGANCQYPPSPEPAAKQVKPPRQGKVPTDPAQVSVSVVTNQGHIGLLLANNESPCTVNSFASLAQQKFFDGTKCHRLTTGDSSSILQCGDPSADGTGGPGYQFPNEYPTDQYKPGDPAAREPVIYPRGTLAMANSGPNTNGSQFFLVYKDTLLPPEYTIFGKIQPDGLATLDKIAKGGVAGGGADGPRAAAGVAPGEGAEQLHGHRGRRADAGIGVVGLCVHVEHGVEVWIEFGKRRVGEQGGVVESLDLALGEEERGAQPVFLNEALGELPTAALSQLLSGLPSSVLSVLPTSLLSQLGL